MLKREWGAESNYNVVPEFVVEERPLGRFTTLASVFAVKDLLLGEHSSDNDTHYMNDITIIMDNIS